MGQPWMESQLWNCKGIEVKMSCFASRQNWMTGMRLRRNHLIELSNYTRRKMPVSSLSSELKNISASNLSFNSSAWQHIDHESYMLKCLYGCLCFLDIPITVMVLASYSLFPMLPMLMWISCPVTQINTCISHSFCSTNWIVFHLHSKVFCRKYDLQHSFPLYWGKDLSFWCLLELWILAESPVASFCHYLVCFIVGYLYSNSSCSSILLNYMIGWPWETILQYFLW